jgi:CRP-like cAMP-binding protein
MIDKGRVAVRVGTRSGDTVTLDVLGPADVLGELALVPPTAPRSATAVAIEETETLVLAASAFDDLCANFPDTVRMLLGLLAERNRALSQRLAEALFATVDTRVARRLAEIHAQGGHAPIPLTQEDVASLAGTTRESANRALRRLQDAGVIELHRGSVRVLDGVALTVRAR